MPPASPSPSAHDAQLGRLLRELLDRSEVIAIFHGEGGWHVRTTDKDGNRHTASGREAHDMIARALERLPVRACRVCKKEKLLACFPLETSGRRPCYQGRNVTCKTCEAARLRKYRDKKKKAVSR